MKRERKPDFFSVVEKLVEVSSPLTAGVPEANSLKKLSRQIELVLPHAVLQVPAVRAGFDWINIEKRILLETWRTPETANSRPVTLFHGSNDFSFGSLLKLS